MMGRGLCVLLVATVQNISAVPLGEASLEKRLDKRLEKFENQTVLDMDVEKMQRETVCGIGSRASSWLSCGMSSCEKYCVGAACNRCHSRCNKLCTRGSCRGNWKSGWTGWGCNFGPNFGIMADEHSRGTWQQWTFEDSNTRDSAGRIQYYIISHRGKYAEDRQGTLQLMPDGQSLGDWQKWTQEPANNGKVYLKSHFGRYLEERQGILQFMQHCCIGYMQEWQLEAVAIPSTLQVNHLNQECWGPCGATFGVCSHYCGPGGACCRAGFSGDPPECGGNGGSNHHRCVNKVGWSSSLFYIKSHGNKYIEDRAN